MQRPKNHHNAGRSWGTTTTTNLNLFKRPWFVNIVEDEDEEEKEDGTPTKDAMEEQEEETKEEKEVEQEDTKEEKKEEEVATVEDLIPPQTTTTTATTTEPQTKEEESTVVVDDNGATTDSIDAEPTTPPSPTIAVETTMEDDGAVVSSDDAVVSSDDAINKEDSAAGDVDTTDNTEPTEVEEELIPSTITIDNTDEQPVIVTVDDTAAVGSESTNEPENSVAGEEEEGSNTEDLKSQTSTTATIESSSSSVPSSSPTIESTPITTTTATDDDGDTTVDSSNEKEEEKEPVMEEETNDESQTTTSVATPEPLPSTPPPTITTTTVTPTPSTTEKTETPLSKVEALRAKAKRVRLEAERLDVVLTLDKISKLEIELESPKVLEDADQRALLQVQMIALKKRLEGDVEEKKDVSGSGSGVVVTSNGSAGSSTSTSVVEETRTEPLVPTMETELNETDLQTRVNAFEKTPKFMQKVVAGAAGFDAEEFNTTLVVLKIYADEVKDYDAAANARERGGDVPKFTQEEIDETVQQLQDVPSFVKDFFAEGNTNDTDVAVNLLNRNTRPLATQEEIDKKLEEFSWIPSFMTWVNKTQLAIDLIEMNRLVDSLEEREDAKESGDSDGDLFSGQQNSTISPPFASLFERFGADIGTPTDNLVEGCFPKECRREGEEPTEAEAKIVLQDVLIKDKAWNPSGQPEKVPGGFIIRGTTKYENGTELIAALDANLATSRIRNRVSLFYVFDPTPVTEEQADFGERPPVLFLMGPQVVRDPTPLQAGLVSTVGVVTLWSSAIYPILLNDKYMKLVEEQVAFSDASMPSNIDFINEMAYPLFVTSLAIHFAHEIAHKVVADSNGMNITFPTLIPSFLTGITGSVTSLAAPPKDKQALLDFAIVGPLAGMIVSLLSLYIGITITASTGAEAYANLPALSLQVLRQSSLAGGLMEAVIPGLLNIPDAAGATKALSEVFIPLHPLAIAGFFGLLVNAVNLLPLGRTDGGRVGLALFGRTGLQVAGFFTSAALLVQGLYGSDLLLFFFSFVVLFQGEMEIPQRNEVDDVDFSRVLLATGAGFLVLLTLIPM